MSWTYRVVKQHVKNKEENFNKYFISELHNGCGMITAATVDVEDYFDNDPIEDLRWQLNRMLEALDKPVVEI